MLYFSATDKSEAGVPEVGVATKKFSSLEGTASSLDGSRLYQDTTSKKRFFMYYILYQMKNIIIFMNFYSRYSVERINQIECKINLRLYIHVYI